MLELAILGLLKEQELHGYELKKRLAETLGVTSGVSFGSLYPALGRLERTGAVVSSVEGAGRPTPIPQTGSLGGELAVFRAPPIPRGRARKVYRITPTGERLFDELLAADPAVGEDVRTFNLRLAFARYLSREARLGLLERRRAHLLERLRRSSSRGRVAERIDTYLGSLLEHDRECAEHDLNWIERLIESERAAAIPSDREAGGAERSRSARARPLQPLAARTTPAAPSAVGTGTPPRSAAGLHKENT
jgi:DNA-binding PadR family transcriptional regulator